MMSTSPATGTDNNAQAINMTALGNLYTLQGLLANMLTNIVLIESGAQGEVITVSNANLYALAAQHYGDPTLWTAIAAANSLNDPYVEATIVVEPTNTKFNNILISGYITPQNMIQLTISNLPYPQTLNISYPVQLNDTLFTIAKNIAIQIPGATASFIPASPSDIATGVVTLPIISPNNKPLIIANVTRYINLTIPQQPGLPTGGVLNL